MRREDSAAVGGLLIAVLLVPHVLAAPGVGLLTDRVRHPHRVLAAAALGFGAALAACAALLGRAPLPVVIMVLLIGGCCGPALTGGLSSQLAGLVEADRLPRSYGLDSMTYNVSGIVGPALGAVVAGLAGPGWAAMVLAGSAVVGGVVLLTLRIDQGADRAATSRTSLWAGFSALARDRVLGTVTVASSLGQLGPAGLPVVAAILAAREGDPALSGWLLTAVAVGGLAGSLAWTWRPASVHRSPAVVTAALIGVGLPLAVASTTTSFPVLVLLFGSSGLFLGPLTGALFTVRQDRSPEQLKAQVFTIGAGLKTTTAATGAALAGALAGLPVGLQLLVAASGPCLAGAGGALALRLRPDPG